VPIFNRHLLHVYHISGKDQPDGTGLNPHHHTTCLLLLLGFFGGFFSIKKGTSRLKYQQNWLKINVRHYIFVNWSLKIKTEAKMI
jgi:hypothetical protein